LPDFMLFTISFIALAWSLLGLNLDEISNLLINYL
jgi:hypothetical protein